MKRLGSTAVTFAIAVTMIGLAGTAAAMDGGSPETHLGCHAVINDVGLKPDVPNRDAAGARDVVDARERFADTARAFGVPVDVGVSPEFCISGR